MADKPDLKPCPFCGAAAVESRVNDVHCSNEECWCFGKTRHVRACEWNTRAELKGQE